MFRHGVVMSLLLILSGAGVMGEQASTPRFASQATAAQPDSTESELALAGVLELMILDLRRELDGLRAEVSAVREELAQKSHIEKGRARIAASHGTRDRSSCREGVAGRRGTIRGRVDFTTPFAAPPIVFMALALVNHYNSDNLRVNAVVDSTDPQGFYYSLYTWCRTDIATVEATWVAIAQ